jgi:hypothetical protein
MPNGAKVSVHTSAGAAGQHQPEMQASSAGTQVLILGEQPMTEVLDTGDPLMEAAGFETCIVPTMLGLPLVIKRLPDHKVLTQSLHHPRNRLVAGLMMDPASGEPLPRWESTDCACLVRRSDHEDFSEEDLKPLSHFLESTVRKAFADGGPAQARKQLTPASYAAFRERPAQAAVLGEGEGGPVLSDWAKLTDKQQEAALRLGWTQQLWDDNELPEIFISTWDELTTQERDDAKILGYNREEWEAEYTSSSDDELPMTDADRAVKGARVKLSEQIKTCQARWWAELPDSGAVSLATMHDLQWHEGDLSDGDNDEWDGTGWKPWLQHLNSTGAEASAEQLKAKGNDAFKSGNFKEAHTLYTAALMKGGSIGDQRERVVAASVRNTETGRSAALNRAACRCAFRRTPHRLLSRAASTATAVAYALPCLSHSHLCGVAAALCSLELGRYSETVEDCTLGAHLKAH